MTAPVGPHSCIHSVVPICCFSQKNGADTKYSHLKWPSWILLNMLDEILTLFHFCVVMSAFVICAQLHFHAEIENGLP